MSKKSDSDFFVRAARCLAGIQDCGNFRAKKTAANRLLDTRRLNVLKDLPVGSYWIVPF